MKNVALSLIIVISFSIVGCINPTSTYSVGKNFSSENVSKVVKGQTAASELTQMFGEPFSKTVISESEEKWIYSYSSGTAKVQSGFLTANVQTTGKRKMLDVLLKNGIVTNFAYTEGDEPFSSGSSSVGNKP